MELPQGLQPPRPPSQGLSLRIGFWVVLLLGIFAWAPATYPGYWQALEGFIPLFNAARPAALATVATIPDLWRGIGGATFLLVRPLLLTGMDISVAVRIGFILYMVLGGLGIYVWLQQRLGDRAAALAGLLYLFAPPLLATVYVQGSLSNMAIVALLPLALAGVSSYCDTRSLSAAGVAVIAIWWMWQAQAGLTAFAALLLLLYTLIVERSWVAMAIVLLSNAAGLTSLAALFHIAGTTAVDFEEHFVDFFQLFTTGWQDRDPFQIGAAIVVFSVLSLWLWLFARKRQAPLVNRLFAFCFVGSAVLIMLTMPVSSGLWRLSHGARLLTYPWQLLLLALPLLAVTAGGLVSFQATLRQIPYWLAILILTLVSSTPYLHADYTHFTPPTSPFALFGAHNNIVILDLSLTENRQPRSAEIAVTWQTLQPLAADYNVFFQALRAERNREADNANQSSPVPGEDQTLTVVRQLDQQPFHGEQPATTWQLGAIYTDTYQLDLTGIAPAEQLIYYFGYYDWRDGARLPVSGGIDDKLIFYGE